MSIYTPFHVTICPFVFNIIGISLSFQYINSSDLSLHVVLPSIQIGFLNTLQNTSYGSIPNNCEPTSMIQEYFVPIFSNICVSISGSDPTSIQLIYCKASVSTLIFSIVLSISVIGDISFIFTSFGFSGVPVKPERNGNTFDITISIPHADCVSL